MKTLFITLILLISLFFFIGYEMFSTYGTMMGVINNPDCPETHCMPCPEKPCVCGEEFSFQNCNFEIMCIEFGYCPACPATFEEEYKACQNLLENLENYD